MEFIWIFAAIFAAACQTARSAFQKNMISKLGEYGAAYIRFCYALPFTSLIWLIWISIPGNNIPDLSLYSLFLCLLGSIFQVLFTYVLMKVFAHKNFATGIAFSKTEVILIAFLEIIIGLAAHPAVKGKFFLDNLKFLTATGIQNIEILRRLVVVKRHDF